MTFNSQIKSKVMSVENACAMLDRMRAESHASGREMKVVFTNGCFDLVHLGHVDYLSKARDLGDLLVVGLNSDASVRGLKGPDRPVSCVESRAAVLAAFAFVDIVVIFNEETPLKIIEALKPDILVKGGDYNRSNIVGADFVESRGGRIETIPLVEGQSTTNLVNRIVKNN